MKITNNYRERIFWRVFKGDDTAYLVGLRQGSIEPGKTGGWTDDSFPDIKVEIKLGDIVFSSKVLAWAGPKFSMKDHLVVDAKGTLAVAQVTMTDGPPVTVQKADLQFFDARKFNETTTREITFSIENAFSASEGFQQSHEHSQTWNVGGKLGGEIGKKDEAKASREVSMQFEDKVLDALQKTYAEQITTVWKQSVSDTFTLKPGMIYAIEVIWRVVLQSGFIAYLGERTSYSVVSSAHGTLTTPSAFESVEAMPEKLREKFNSFQRT